MKIVHLTRHFFPEYSGTSTRLFNLLCRLPSGVCVVTSNRKINGEIISQAGDRYENVEVRRLPVPTDKSPAGIPALRYPRTIYHYYRVHRDVLKAVGDEKWDIVQAHNVLPFAEAARKLAGVQHTPSVFELHGIAEESLSGITRFIGNAYLQKETQKLVGQADRVITLTQSLKEWLCTRYRALPEKVTVVPNGADIERFSPDNGDKREAENLKQKLGVTGRTVMYAGAIDSINGLGDLARVIPRIIKEKPDISFVFIGNGPELPKLVSLSNTYPHNVKCLDQVPYAEMPVYYRMCDVFIIPRPSTISSETLTPLKLLEAMAAGKPVLGSDVGGITEVIKHGENGYLFRKGDLTDLEKTLLEVMDADNIKVGRNARETIISGYTWENSSRVLWQVYEDLSGKRVSS